MRLDRLLLPIAAGVLVAACNPLSADRGGAARAPIPAMKAPAAQSAAAGCPCAEKEKAKATAAAAPRRKVVAQKAVANPERRTYRRYEALAGGPPRAEYARVPQEYYADSAATTYRYGPAYPRPAVREPDHGYRDYSYSEREDGWRDHRRYERDDYEDRRARHAPPPREPEDRYGPEGSQRREGGSAYSERYSSREDEARRVPPPPAGYGYRERRAYEGRYEERSESESSYEFRSASQGRPCCHSEAAGFDANGFLTWPGKVPARP